jgi:hypothetical protein
MTQYISHAEYGLMQRVSLQQTCSPQLWRVDWDQRTERQVPPDLLETTTATKSNVKEGHR